MRTKIGFLGLVVAGFVIGSVVATNAVLADSTTPVTPVKHHHHHHHIHGKVESVASDGSSITITVHHHHKKGSTSTTPTTEEKTVNIDSNTKIEIVSADGTKTAGSVSDLVAQKHVSVVEGKKGVAAEITVGHAKHHHKKKPVSA